MEFPLYFFSFFFRESFESFGQDTSDGGDSNGIEKDPFETEASSFDDLEEDEMGDEMGVDYDRMEDEDE